MILDPHGMLLPIRIHCEKLIEDAKEALRYPLIAEGSHEDDPAARKALTDAARAARELMGHLDKSYDLDGGRAEAREGVCLE